MAGLAEMSTDVVDLSFSGRRVFAKTMFSGDSLEGHFPHDYIFSTPGERAAYRSALVKLHLAPAEAKCFVLKEVGQVSGLGVLSRLDWDSDYFGHEIHALHVFFVPWVAPAQRKAFIAEAIKCYKACFPVRQIVAPLSDAGENTFQALQALGFRSQGRSRTLYTAKVMKPLSGLRNERCDMVVDGDAVPVDGVAALACRINFPSRIYQESLCCPEKVRQMHGHWVRRILSRERSDRSVKIFLRNGEAVGLAASEKLPLPPGHEDIRVFGRTLFGFLPGQGYHALDSLLRAGLQDALAKCHIIESTVSESNHVTLRMLQRAGHQVGRTNHTMTLTI